MPEQIGCKGTTAQPRQPDRGSSHRLQSLERSEARARQVHEELMRQGEDIGQRSMNMQIVLEDVLSMKFGRHGIRSAAAKIIEGYEGTGQVADNDPIIDSVKALTSEMRLFNDALAQLHDALGNPGEWREFELRERRRPFQHRLQV